jgi:hypothetical protein
MLSHFNTSAFDSTSSPLLNILFVRHFTSGPTFDVNGVEMSRDEILALDPSQRTVAHWLVVVDWDLQRQRPYVIIDPYDPSGLLYLNSAEYLLQTRTLASANVPFIVICRPGTQRPVPTKTPPLSEERVGCVDHVFTIASRRKTRARGRFQRYIPQPLGTEGDVPVDFSLATWKQFSDLRKWISKNAPWGEGETVKVNDGNIMGLLVMWHRELLHYLDVKSPGRRIKALMPLVQHLQTLLRHNGPAFTIQRLKISLFCLYSYVGGNPVTSSQMTELGHRIRLRGGLPYFLDRSVRDSIRERNPDTIRCYASLLNIYKVLWGPHGESPLTTITAPAYTGDTGDLSSFMMDGSDGFFARWEREIGKALPGWEYRTSSHYLIASAGANASCAMQSIYRDALAWNAEGRNLPLEWLELWGDGELAGFLKSVTKEASEWQSNTECKPNSLLPIPWEKEPSRVNSEFLRLLGKIETDEYATRPSDGYLLKLAEKAGVTPKTVVKGGSCAYVENGEFTPAFFDSWYAALQHFVRVGVHPDRWSYSRPITGRLHSIPEPAGKVRVVAICDYFTQVGLKPLHEYIFKLLKCNPNDATFGQQEAVDKFAAKGYKEIFSYDLKAATDLIPVCIYREVLEPLIGRRGADLWVQLLQNRTFLAPKDVRKSGVEWVRYSRGQPMGALSSWACLALGHHALVQFAAKRAGVEGWFAMYLVLGDDIVIAHREVAQAYLDICAEFGIKVGLAKSLISNMGLMNFASQTLLGQDNLSPISLGEELVALNWARRKELANRIGHRYGRGTGAKATMLALRRALTANQWSALQGELTGFGGGFVTRFVRFILQNPFVQLSETNRCYIESVVEWLGLLCPELLRLSQTKASELKSALEQALWADLKATLDKKLREYKEAKMESLAIVNSSRYGTFESGTVLWRYLSKALADHFGRIRDEKLYPLEDTIKAADAVPDFSVIADLWFALSKVPAVSDSFTDGPRENVFRVIKDQDVTETMGGDAKVQVGKLGAVVGKLPAPKAPKESLRAPLQALLLAVARVLGVILPGLSILDKPVSRGFGNALRSAIRAFEDSRISRDASVPWMNSPLCPVRVEVVVPECLALVRISEDDEWDAG